MYIKVCRIFIGRRLNLAVNLSNKVKSILIITAQQKKPLSMYFVDLEPKNNKFYEI